MNKSRLEQEKNEKSSPICLDRDCCLFETLQMGVTSIMENWTSAFQFHLK